MCTTLARLVAGGADLVQLLAGDADERVTGGSASTGSPAARVLRDPSALLLLEVVA